MEVSRYNGVKCLVFSPQRYSITKSLETGLTSLGAIVKTADYESFFSKGVNRFVGRYSSLPNRLKKRWMNPYIANVNRRYAEIAKSFKPDVVLVYNNQLIMPWLLDYLKQGARIVFILGDNPLYTPTNVYNLHLLFSSDLVICPDTMWTEQLARIGVPNVRFDCFSWNSDQYFEYAPTGEVVDKYRSDLVYIGSGHKSNWGYKRFLFLNQFSGLDMKAYISGEGYGARWEEFFPDLKKHIVEHRIFSPAFNNMVFNCSRISPVELVPSLFHGIHVRLFEALGAGTLPLCEFSKDLDLIFEGINFPAIMNYGEARDIALFYINNEPARKDLVVKMQNRVLENYSPGVVTQRILDDILS